MTNVVFLDFDGVVNSLIWKDGDFKYNFPKDDSVNNYQACQWVSKFCKDNGYSIVVSSTWRSEGLENCERYLRKGGIWSEIPVIGVTPKINGAIRGDEIADYLMKHEVGQFLIFDDDSDMGSLADHLVKCNTQVGFTFKEYQLATVLHGVFQENKI